ncbi:MAG: hypothetical protein AABW81_01955, partial [Nanoarchaeota archaeon]
MIEGINKLRELRASEVNSKAIYEIISNYQKVEDIPRGATKCASFEQLFFPPFRRLLEKDREIKSNVLEKIAINSKVSQEDVKKYLYDCSDTYIPAIIKQITNLREDEMENLRDGTQQVILNELRK